MKQYLQLLNRILTASNRGLDIITDVCPAAAEVVNRPKQKFRLRSDERTPSAQLCPPKDSEDSWSPSTRHSNSGLTTISAPTADTWTVR